MLEVADLLVRSYPTTIPSPSAASAGVARSHPEEATKSCDALLMVGTNLPYTEYLPGAGQAKVVQLEADRTRAGNRADLDAAVAAMPAHPGPALPGVSVNGDEAPMPGKVAYERGREVRRNASFRPDRRSTVATTLFNDRRRELRS